MRCLPSSFLTLVVCLGVATNSLAAPLITEFLADNSSSIVDVDGAHSDWLEIYNPDATPIDLAGWKLTDTAANLGKWTFPSVTVNPNSYLIVWASGKNRTVVGQQLHTNFAISKKAGFLALTAPGGTTATSSYNYPAQKTDVAYGVAKQPTAAYPINAATSSVFVPSGGSPPAAGWNTAGYTPDAAWLASPAPPGTGYDTTSPAATPANIVGSGVATQSTTLWPYTANLAANTLTTDFTQTIAADTHPFWNLDFGSNAVISSITITNRSDANQSRLRDILVEVLDDNQEIIYAAPVLNPGNTGFTYPAGPATLSVNFVTLTGGAVTGRHVRISRTGDPTLTATGGLGDDNDRYVLSLAEVAVQGTLALVNLARTGTPAPTAVQTSTNGAFNASLAIDGINTNFTHTLATAGEAVPSWTLNLNRKAAISIVNLHNREACCPERLRDITVEIFAADPGTGVVPTNPPIHTSPLLNPTNTMPNPIDIVYNAAAANGNTPVLGQWIRVKRAPDLVTPPNTVSLDDLRVLSMGEVQIKGLDLTGYRPFIRRDIQTAMLNNSPTAYLRVPFNIADLATVAGLSLRMRYDDGFVAYLNGTEVARRNAPATPDQTSVATLDRLATEGATTEIIDLAAALPLLTANNNVLAIHGLNSAAADTNFLLQPELVVTNQPVIPAAFLVNATPGGLNATTWYLNTVADTVFSHRRGFYDTAFNLTITSTTPGAAIYYTLDNSEPTPNNGVLYTTAIPINKTSVVRARAYQTNYRATNIDTHTYIFLNDVTTAPKGGLTTAGVASGTIPPRWPTSAATNGGQAFNFGFTPGLLAPYSQAQLRTALTQIPSISVVTQQNNLTDPTTGFYVNGTNGHGEAWERPGSIEMLDINHPGATVDSVLGHGEFSENAGFRLRGGASRADSAVKHSFRVFFRNSYGNGKLDYPLYGNKGATSFDTFDLRGSQNYAWSSAPTGTEETLVRDPFSLELMGAMGQPYTRSRFVHLYLNGLYWGVFEIQERPENSFGETYLGGSKDDYDVVKNRDRYSGTISDGTGVVATNFSTEATNGYLLAKPDGSRSAWKELWDRTLAIWQNGDKSSASFYRLMGCNPDGTRNLAYPVLLDVDNLIDYTLALFYTGDGDACLSGFLSFNTPNNWYGMRDRNGNRGFVFVNHDAEHTLRASSWAGSRPQAATDQTGPFGGSNQTLFLYSNPQWMHEELLQHPEYKLRYADHIRKHFFNGGALTPATTNALWSSRVNTISSAINIYAARYATATTAIATWNALCIGPNGAGVIDNIPGDYLTPRTTDLLNMLKVDGLYPATEAVDFSQHGGAVPAGGSITLTAPTGGSIIYYTTDGSDPRLTQERPTPLTFVPSNASTKYKVTTAVTDGFTLNATGSEPTPGPIGRWKLDGNLTDNGSGAAGNGTPTLVGAPGYVSPGADGTGQAISLNGTSQYVNLGDPVNLQITGQITISAWIKPAAFPATGGQANIVNKGHNTAPNGEITLRLENGNNLTIGTWNGTNFVTTVANVVQLNQWQHVCGVFDGSAWRIYRNAVQGNSFATAQGAVAVTGTANTAWAIGARGGGGARFFNGQIDDVRIYNRGLSPTEVSNLYLGNVPTYNPDWKATAYTVPVDWSTGNGGFGFDANAGVDYSPFITTNLPTMQNGTPTLLTRSEFTVTPAQLASATFLQMNVRYDDGFIAYLNGTKILERNAPNSPAILHGLAAATAVRADADAIVQEKVDITTAGMPLLVNGTNVLAIQGLNTTAADSDFLLQAEIVAGDKSAFPSPSAQISTGTLALTTSGTVKTRAFNPATGQWSALTEAYFSVGTVPASASNLAISELHYHPADPSTPAEMTVSLNSDDFEFVEVMNISATDKVEMTDVAFTTGVFYTFGHLVLPPGGKAVIAAKPTAFAARYGNGIVLAGNYSRNLGNSGDQIVLKSATGAIIRDFSYGTLAPWPTTPDGAGPSLTLIHPTSNPDHSLPQNWRASIGVGGTAGTTDATRYADWKTTNSIPSDAADEDHDGLNALLEYAFGGNPTDPSQAQLPAAITQPDGSTLITYTVPPGADDIAYTIEISTDLSVWQNPGAALTYLGEANGQRTWSLAAAAPTITRRYCHVKATLR